MPRRRSWLRRFAFVIGIGFALVGISAVLERLGAGGVSLGSSVGVVELQGEIRDAETIVDDLAGLRKEPSVVAVVVRIDSPGGAVARRRRFTTRSALKESKPVVASLGSIAASGGYYIGRGQHDRRRSGTLTGSIGVIMQFSGRQLAGWASRRSREGRFGDVGNRCGHHGPSGLSEHGRRRLRTVRRGRRIGPRHRSGEGAQLADGRLSGPAGESRGLRRQLGSYSARSRSRERAGQTGGPRCASRRWRPWWIDMIGEA
jgi:protease-4